MDDWIEQSLILIACLAAIVWGYKQKRQERHAMNPSHIPAPPTWNYTKTFIALIFGGIIVGGLGTIVFPDLAGRVGAVAVAGLLLLPFGLLADLYGRWRWRRYQSRTLPVIERSPHETLENRRRRVESAPEDQDFPLT